MADNEPVQTQETPPPKQPFSPGVLMVLGLFLLVIAAWCGYDLYSKEAWVKEGATYKIVINWAGLVVFAIGAIYAFILAAVRSKKGVAGAPKTPE